MPDPTDECAHSHPAARPNLLTSALTTDRIVIAGLAALLSGGAVSGITIGTGAATSTDPAIEHRLEAVEAHVEGLDTQLDLIIRLLETQKEP